MKGGEIQLLLGSSGLDVFVAKRLIESKWWFQICFVFIPIWGSNPILTSILFQMGWFNHQLVMLDHF